VTAVRSNDTDVSHRPGLGTTYLGHDPALLTRVLPLVDYIETTPDSLALMERGSARIHPQCLAELKGIGGEAQIIVHGTGLSIGSHEGWVEGYLDLLDELLEHVDVAWHSEHLGYTVVDGENLGTMLAMPRTEEALDMLSDRILAIQRRYAMPFLVENIIHMLPDYPGEYSQAAFLNALVARTGCGLILDVYNLECDAYNHGLDIYAFLSELDLTNVREVHVACGSEHRGFLLDAHSRTTRPSTVDLARRVIGAARGAVKVVTFELLREAVPAIGHDAIADELRNLRAALGAPGPAA
jgi:uncharacterized protein